MFPGAPFLKLIFAPLSVYVRSVTIIVDEKLNGEVSSNFGLYLEKSMNTFLLPLSMGKITGSFKHSSTDW